MRINPRFPASRAARRASAALALAAGTLAVTAAGALAAPAITVTPSTGLDLGVSNSLTVTGTGFTDTHSQDTNLGVYVFVTATVDGRVYAADTGGQYLRVGFPAPTMRLATDGSFSTTVTAPRRFTSGATEIDCAAVQCVVRAWNAHTQPDATTTLATKAITFALPTPGTPEVTVAPKSDLSRDTPTEVTISGTGFDPNAARGLGFYVAYGPKTASYWTQSARAFGAVKRVSAGATASASADVLNPDGSWRTTLIVSPTYTGADGNTYDCRVIECGILTFAAQGNADRTFDTATAVTFAPLPPAAEVTPTTGLNRDAATTVTIRGQNYLYRLGAYVGLTATVDGVVLYGDQTTFRWVRTATMGARAPEDTITGGAFNTTIAVTPTFTTDRGVVVDCRVTQCAISTWPAHSIPTPATLYTNAPLTFAAAVIPPPERRVDPLPNPTPTVVAPKATSVKGAQKVGKNGVATVGTIVVGSQDATLKPYKLTLKIGKKRYAASVVVPKSVKAGKKATVKVKLSKKAIAALKGRSVKVTVKVKVTAGGKATTVSTKATLKGATVKKAVKKK